MIVYCECKDCANKVDEYCRCKWSSNGMYTILIDDDGRCTDYVPNPCEETQKDE